MNLEGSWSVPSFFSLLCVCRDCLLDPIRFPRDKRFWGTGDLMGVFLALKCCTNIVVASFKGRTLNFR